MELAPLKLHPAYKEYLWGGRRLREDYHKEDAPEITAVLGWASRRLISSTV